MNIELEIISNIIDRSAVKDAKKAGITSDFFRTSLAREAWDWAFSEYEANAEVPDETRLLRQFPDFDYRPTKNSIGALYKEAVDLYMDKDTQDAIAKMEKMLIEDELDARTVIIEGIEMLKDIQSTRMANDGAFLRDSTQQLKSRYELRQKTDGVIGIPYPYDCMNAMTGGMGAGEVIYIYGRPGQMKSWLLAVIAAHSAKAGKRVMMYTKEIDDVSFMERVASIVLEVDYSSFRSGHLPPEESDRFYDFIDHPGNYVKGDLFFVTDKGCKYSRTVDQLMAIAERIEPDILFIDGFYLLNPGRASTKKADHEKIKDISRSIKSYAQSLGIPVVCTSQANREGKNNASVGTTEDAAFSDAVGQDADAMFRCYKGANPVMHAGNSLLVIPKKIREGGVEGTPRAFVINACPSYDWSLQQYPADAKKFFQDNIDNQDGQRMQGATTAPFRKPRRDTGPFRV